MATRRSLARSQGFEVKPPDGIQKFTVKNNVKDKDKIINYSAEPKSISSSVTNDANLRAMAKDITSAYIEQLKIDPPLDKKNKVINVKCKDPEVEKKFIEMIKDEIRLAQKNNPTLATQLSAAEKNIKGTSTANETASDTVKKGSAPPPPPAPAAPYSPPSPSAG